MDRDAVERYLQEHLGRDARVVDLSMVPMGLSRQTWFVTLADRRLVLRCDLPGGISSCPTTLRFEYEVYRRLADTDVPVARPLWFEEDADRLGTLLYVREFVDGSPSVPHFDDPDPRYDDLRVAVSMEHARKMALVHRVDWRALGFDELMSAPASPQESALHTLDRLEAQFDAIGLEPLPLVTETYAWMREHLPPPPEAVVLCKGSNGAMQEVWRDGRIVGMSDWELASLGDPANDWARCQGFVPTIPGRWDEEKLLDYYAEVSGLRVDPRALAFYRLVYGLEMIIVGHHAGRPVAAGQSRDARLAFLAGTPVHRFEEMIARAMALV